jgi:hypothetical protein
MDPPTSVLSVLVNPPWSRGVFAFWRRHRTHRRFPHWWMDCRRTASWLCQPCLTNPLTVSAISLFVGSRSVGGLLLQHSERFAGHIGIQRADQRAPDGREIFAQTRGGSLRTDAQRQGAVPRCPNPARSCRAMERTASTKLAIRPVDCSASSSSVLSFIRKAIHHRVAESFLWQIFTQ